MLSKALELRCLTDLHHSKLPQKSNSIEPFLKTKLGSYGGESASKLGWKCNKASISSKIDTNRPRPPRKKTPVPKINSSVVNICSGERTGLAEFQIALRLPRFPLNLPRSFPAPLVPPLSNVRDTKLPNRQLLTKGECTAHRPKSRPPLGRQPSHKNRDRGRSVLIVPHGR